MIRFRGQPGDAVGDGAAVLPSALRRDIIVLVALKFAALGLIYWAFFREPEATKPVGAAAIADHLLGTTLIENHGEPDGPR